MEDNRKRIITISTIIVIILVIGIILLGFKLIDIKKKKENIAAINENIITENEINNNVIKNENDVDNEINNEVENNVNQNIVNDNATTETPIADPEQEVDKQTIQKEENNQEKAVNIAKKDWGEDNSVYFSFEGIDESGKYMVCVRDQETRALRFYKIDINTGTFTIE